MIEPLCISTVVMTSALVGARVILTRRKTGKTGTDKAPHPPGDYSIIGKLPRQTVLDHQPSLAEMMSHLNDISPFGKDSEQTRKFQRRYIDSWNRCLEKNLAEIVEGDGQGVELYCYEIDRSDPVCRNHLLQGTFVRRTEIRLFSEIIPPFHLGCSCRLRRLYYASRSQPGAAFHPLFIKEELPVLPDWRERAEVCEPSDAHNSAVGRRLSRQQKMGDKNAG